MKSAFALLLLLSVLMHEAKAQKRLRSWSKKSRRRGLHVGDSCSPSMSDPCGANAQCYCASSRRLEEE